jgi:D-alanyl-D-alanine carboxypeptidase
MALGLGAAAVTGSVLTKSDDVLAHSAISTPFYRTTAALNLRTGPGPRRRVLLVIPANAVVTGLGGAKYGYRQVVYNGTTGWAFEAYLVLEGGDSPAPGTLVTTAPLNLRAEPSLSARVLLVMPSGATVTPTGKGSGQFAQVVYRGTTGWAATAYLN